MEKFYEGILSGMGRAEALRASQLWVKSRKPDPVYWGAFICQGEAGPIAFDTAQLPREPRT
jgi:CHAT domain-containing protein